MRKLLTFVAVIFTYKIAINSAIECHSCRAVPQELCKKATDLSLTVSLIYFSNIPFRISNQILILLYQQCHEPSLMDKKGMFNVNFCLIFQLKLCELTASGATAACIKIVFKSRNNFVIEP